MIEEKHRRIKYTIGITAAVYLSFRYLLPLVIPFLLAFLLAMILLPAVLFIQKKLHIKENIAAVIILAVGIVIVTGGLLIVGVQLWKQLQRLLYILPNKLQFISQQIYALSSTCESLIGVAKGSLTIPIQQLIEQESINLQKMLVNYSFQNSVVVIQKGIQLFAGTFVMLLSCLIMIRDRGIWKRRFKKSVFYMEGRLLLDKLSNAGGHWIRVQAIIMLIITAICIVGLWIIGSSYPFLAGIGIGLLDALPLFGTGTIFIPWILIVLLQRKWVMAAELTILYLITYITREIMEERMMGESIGMTSLEFLVSVYIGWKVFGLGGFILGPAALLVIRMGLLLID